MCKCQYKPHPLPSAPSAVCMLLVDALMSNIQCIHSHKRRRKGNATPPSETLRAQSRNLNDQCKLVHSVRARHGAQTALVASGMDLDEWVVGSGLTCPGLWVRDNTSALSPQNAHQAPRSAPPALRSNLTIKSARCHQYIPSSSRALWPTMNSPTAGMRLSQW